MCKENINSVLHWMNMNGKRYTHIFKTVHQGNKYYVDVSIIPVVQNRSFTALIVGGVYATTLVLLNCKRNI